MAASSGDDPAQIHATFRLKVWLGLLDDNLVGRISYEEGEEPACCFKCHGPLAEVAMVPYGPALSASISLLSRPPKEDPRLKLQRASRRSTWRSPSCHGRVG